METVGGWSVGLSKIFNQKYEQKLNSNKSYLNRLEAEVAQWTGFSKDYIQWIFCPFLPSVFHFHQHYHFHCQYCVASICLRLVCLHLY